MRFLDRFAYRNPKDVKKDKAAPGGTARRISSRSKGYAPPETKRLPVTSAEYTSKKVTHSLSRRHIGLECVLLVLETKEIPADERFLHSYLSTFAAPQGKDGGDSDWEADSVGSEEAEALIGAFEPGDAGREVFDVDFEGEFGKPLIHRKAAKSKRLGI